jgi:predicted membrane protein
MNGQNQNDDFYRSRNNGRILAGLFLLLIGALFLMKEMSFPFFPYWLFTWPMILIAVGIYTGIKHEFRNPGWIILILVGGVFLADEMNFGFDLHRFIVPMIIIGAGLVMILRPRRHRDRDWKRRRDWDWRNYDYSKPEGTTSSGQDSSEQDFPKDYSNDDFFDSTSVFSGAKKVILSKNFQRGDITCVFGGCEIDLTQADMQKPAVIDLNLAFGGGKIIIPPDWQVRLDITPVFGGIEDKRKQPISNNPGKILIIKGTCFFGGLEIKNY